MRFLLFHYVDVMNQSAEFQQLTYDELSTLLKSDNLNVCSENLACISAKRWVQFCPDERKNCYASLLACCRLCLVNYEYLTKEILSDSIIFNDLAALSLIQEGNTNM